MRARAVKFASLMSLAFVAGAIGADLARSRHGSGVIRAAAKATVELAGGDILSWNLTLAGLLGSPFNLHPPNSVVYLQRSRVSATGSDVTFDYSGIEGADQRSGNSFFDEIRGYRPSGPRQRDKTAPENIFDAAGGAHPTFGRSPFPPPLQSERLPGRSCSWVSRRSASSESAWTILPLRYDLEFKRERIRLPVMVYVEVILFRSLQRGPQRSYT